MCYLKVLLDEGFRQMEIGLPDLLKNGVNGKH